MNKKLKVLTNKDSVIIIFGEWFDKTYGNTYYDAKVYINDDVYIIPYQYGYNHGDNQAVTEALEHCGYRLRINKRDRFAPYRRIHVECIDKLKRELHKWG